jgi:hypothetical protein
MAADVKHVLLQRMSAGLTVEQINHRAAELFEPFLELAQNGGGVRGGGDSGGDASAQIAVKGVFPTAKAFVCMPDAADAQVA